MRLRRARFSDLIERQLDLFERENRGLIDDALVTIRHFTVNRKPPAYFHLLEAQAWAAKKNWERSWNAWQTFEKAKAPNH